MAKIPFRYGARQSGQKVGAIVYAAASTLPVLNLPRVGMLSRVFINFRGVVTLSGAGALADLGPWNLASRLRVFANIGSADIVNVSGYGGFLAQQTVDSLGFRPDKAGVGDTTNDADVFAAPVAMGANTWCLWWILPISANAGREFDIGMIDLQAPETTVSVEITTGALLDPATLVTATTGSFHVYYEYYEIPNPNDFELPALSLVRLLEDSTPIGQTGENIYTVPRMGVLLQMQHLFIANAVRSDAYDSASIKFNKTATPYAKERQWLKLQQRAFYGNTPIVGAYLWDFWRAGDGVAEGDTRDAIDSEELSTFESVITVTAGTALGANASFLRTIRRIVQTLE